MIPPNIIDQIADERDELRKENNMLKYRIKRMLTSGDELCVFASQYGYTRTWVLRSEKAVRAWNKSKEARP